MSVSVSVRRRISHVYGRQRTFVTVPGGDIDVVHYVFKHPRRYKVDFQHERALPELVLAGQRAVFDWMVAHRRPRGELNSFRESCVRVGERDGDGRPKALLNLARRRRSGKKKHTHNDNNTQTQ
jgi:hypothetical protein